MRAKGADELAWMRDLLLPLDDILKPVMGIRDWDDAACLEFDGRLVVSADGPYAKRLVLKSALIHAAGDVVVKGGRPLFALDTMIGPEEDVREMITALKTQAEAMGIPLVGGNTLFDEVEARCSITVAGRLECKEPVRDNGAKEGDTIVLVGEPIWGTMDERMPKAKTLFTTWLQAVKEVDFHAAKDVTKGGLRAAVGEMEWKSGRKFKLDENPPYPSGRNLDNFIATLTEYEHVNLERICAKNGCKLTKIGCVE